MDKTHLLLGLLVTLSLFSCKTVGGSSDLQSDESIPFGAYRFDQVTWIATHNSHVNNKDSKWIAPNQGNESVEMQLNAGVRALMVDIWSHDKKATLCHGNCRGIPLISPRQDFGKFLNTVVKFLNSNRNEIVTVFLEDYASSAELKTALDSAAGLRDLQFDPNKEDVRGKGWPKIGDMVRSNKRLIIFSDKGDKEDIGAAFEFHFTVQNYWSLGNIKADYTCKQRWDDMPMNRKEEHFERLFVMNQFRDIPNPTAELNDNKYENLMSRAIDYCLPVSDRKPNFVAVDIYHHGDVKAFVDRMNQVRAAVFADPDFGTKAKLLFMGDKLNLVDLQKSVGDDAITSVRVFPNTKVVLFADPDWQNPLMDLTSGVRNIGDADDKTSSLRVELP